MLQCSFPDPHHPFTPPGEYYDMYAPADMVMPETFNDDHSRSMPNLQQMVAHRGKQTFPVAAFAPTGEQLREMLAAQYGAITMIDDAIGRVLAALHAAGRDNAIVVFTSDHGDMFGDHGVALKAGLHFEGCVRVPLTISAPSVAAGRTNALVNHLDVGTTILELAGLHAAPGQQGRSLTPVLDDLAAPHRDVVVIEEDQMFDIMGTGSPLRMRTVITDQLRYTRVSGAARGELFDLSSDPAERNNLFDAAAPSRLQRDADELLINGLMDVADQTRRATYLA
jgi:arylsulfatase A-like enzyme